MDLSIWSAHTECASVEVNAQLQELQKGPCGWAAASFSMLEMQPLP